MKLQLHGHPCVWHGEARSKLADREAALLAWLHFEGPTPRATIAGLLWAAGDDCRARTNLRQLLVRLRRSCGALIAERDGVMHLADGVQIVQAKGRILGSIELDDAPELASWLDIRREDHRRAQMREGLEQARRAFTDQQLDAALVAADLVLQHEPASEEAHRIRMEVFWHRGDRAAALQAWDDCRLALRQQLGVQPNAITDALGHQILAGASSAAPLRAGFTLPRSLLHPETLFGRASEVKQLENALNMGWAVEVRGVAGIGKSRLMSHVAASIQPYLWISGRPGDEHLPGATIARLVAKAISEFGLTLDAKTRADLRRLMPSSLPGARQVNSAAEFARMISSAARVLQASKALGLRLLVVDDMQFADDLSLQALSVIVDHWVAEAGEGALPLLFACRPGELRPAAQRVSEQLLRSKHCLRLDIRPLTRDAMVEALAQLPVSACFERTRTDLAKALHTRVGGVPAHWLEALRLLWRDAPDTWNPGESLPLPTTLVAQVRQRLQRLSPHAQYLAQLAAIAQPDFSLGLAAAALARAPLELSPLYAELEAACVFSAGGFAHDLVAEAVSESVPTSMRAQLHRLIAEFLQNQPSEPAAVARHFGAAGAARLAGLWHQRAGELAQAQWRQADAAMHFELSADHLSVESPEVDRQARFACLRRAARALANLNRYQEADRLLQAAESLALPDAEFLELLHVRIPCWIMINEVHKARAGLEALIASLENASSNLPATTQDSTWNCVLCFSGYVHRASRLLNLSRGYGRNDGLCSDQELAARGSFFRLIDNHGRAIALVAPIVRKALAETRRSTIALNAAVIWVRSSLAIGSVSAADEALTAMTALHREMGNGVLLQLEVSWHRAMSSLAAGDPASALDLLRTMRAELAATGFDPRVNLDHYSMLEATSLAALGDHERALNIVAELSARVPTQSLGPDPRQMWVSKLGAQLALKLNLDVEPWLERLVIADCNRYGDSLSLDTECILAICGKASPKQVWQRAQQCARLPLGHVLRQAIPADMPRDPWLYPI